MMYMYMYMYILCLLVLTRNLASWSYWRLECSVHAHYHIKSFNYFCYHIQLEELYMIVSMT